MNTAAVCTKFFPNQVMMPFVFLISKTLTCSDRAILESSPVRGSPLGALYSKTETWLLQGHFIYLQQVKENTGSSPNPCLPTGRLSLGHCSYTLFGRLHVDLFFAVGYICPVAFFKKIDFGRRGEGERQREINLSFYLFTYSLADPWTHPAQGQIHSLGVPTVI